jgi:hypothetical protein
MALEEQAEVEQGRLQQSPVLQEQRDEEATNPAIAVEIGMGGLELDVRQARPHQRRQVILRMQIFLQIAEHIG